MAELAEFRDHVRDVSERGLERAPAVVGVSAEASDPLDLEGKVQLPFLFEPCALGLGQDAGDELAAELHRHRPVFKGGEASVHAHHGRRVGAQMQVGRARSHCTGQQIHQIKRVRFHHLSPC